MTSIPAPPPGTLFQLFTADYRTNRFVYDLFVAVSGTTFSIVGRGLKFDSLASIQSYLLELEDAAGLTDVRLGGNTLGVEACAGVGAVLAKKESLVAADFSDIFTGRLISEIPQALRSLCTSLLHLKHLTSLDLSDNAFGGRSVEPMLEFISTHPTLKVLKLNNNGMGPAGGADIAGALLANAEKSKVEGRVPSLQTLICGRNRLENGSATAFGAAFAALGSLREVRMFQNGIRMEGIAAIVKGLRSNPDLEVLDLDDNTATLKGSRAIAESLPSWPKLTTLNLNDCLLRTRGGVIIGQTLLKGTNPLLSSIRFQSNELGAAAVSALASAISVSLTHLTCLELNGNCGEAEDDCYNEVRVALEKWDHGDALDELDELEEEEEDEEEDGSDQEEDNEVEKEDREGEAAEPKVEAKDLKDSDDLAKLLGTVHIV